MDGLGGHHEQALALAEAAVYDPDIGDNSPVGVVHRVEDERSRRGIRVPVRRRDLLDDGVEELFHAFAGLGGDSEDFAGVGADDLGDLLRVALRLRGGEVDLVEHRDDPEVGFQRHVQVGERLRLDALRGVHEEHGALAGGQASRYLVAEVDVAGGVDQVQDVVAVITPPGQPDGLALDRDAALTLDVHPVQVLGAHLAPFDDTGQLQHAVGQRGLAVIDVRDDAEVADHGLVRTGRRRRLG